MFDGFTSRCTIPPAVDHGERLRDLTADTGSLGAAEATARDQVGERGPRDEFHREIRGRIKSRA
ncbi:hypothetical protein HR12_35360 [Microbacterium sp. SUBG005]|nr:hypothetical protein HR12_35360 [Microbacterium sp. SUBG005]